MWHGNPVGLVDSALSARGWGDWTSSKDVFCSRIVTSCGSWPLSIEKDAFTSTPPVLVVFKPLANSSRDFDVILKRAGIPKVDALGRKATAHSFRNTYATLMAERTGHNPFVLKEILGHKCLSTTERYCHLTAPSLPISWQEITPLGQERGVGSWKSSLRQAPDPSKNNGG